MPRTVTVKLLAEVNGYVSPIKAAQQATTDLRNEIAKAADEGKLDKLGATAGRLGLGLTGGFLLATTAAARFEKAMSEVDAVAGASEDQMKQLSDAALKAGKDTQYSATEAAKAEAELAKAGLSASDILSGALTGSLSLAAAGQLDLSEAADTAAKAMNIFNLQGKDVGHIADVLAAASNKSATDVHELAFALKMGGLAAKNSGVSLEETVGTLAAFADNALTGSDAGTSFKQMLQMLAAPTEKSTALMAELGISAYDAQGNFVGIAGLADVLQKQLGGLTQEQRNNALATIFGSDAMRAATVLYSEGAQGIKDYTLAVNDQGAAADVAKKKTDNLQGDIERLTGSLETLFIEAGTGTNSGLRILVQALGEVVDMVGRLPPSVLTAITLFAGLSGVALLAFSAFVKIRNSVHELVEELKEAGPATGRLAVGIESTTKWAARGALALTGMQIAGALLNAALHDDLNPQVEALSEGLAQFGENGQLGGEALRVIGDNAGDLGRILNGVANSGWSKGFDNATDALLGLVGQDSPMDKAKEQAQALDAALAQLASSGHADQAAAAFKRIWEEAQKQGISLDKLQAAFPEYVAAAADAAKATDAQALAAADAKANNIKLAGAFGEAASEADGLKAAFDELNGAELNWRDAERKAEQAVDDLADALKESGGSLDVHNEKGRNAAAAVDALADAAAKAAQAKMDETGSVEEANKVYTSYIDQLRATLLQTGLTKDQVDALVDSIATMPTMKTINITANVRVAIQTAIPKILASLPDFLRRDGGITVHAATGTLRDAAVYSARTPARYAFAEPATGGEAFVPRRGDYGRSMSILDTAAGWYGAQVVPQGWYGGTNMAGSGEGGTVRHVVDVQLNGRTVRTLLITDGTDRNVSQDQLRAAYP